METPIDKRLFMPRGDGLGWSLNFENKWSYWVLGGIFAFVLVVIAWGMFSAS